MASATYAAPSAAAVALAAATAKVAWGVLAPAQFGCDLYGFSFGFDGVTAAAAPVTVELCRATFATNPPGTASTSITVQQEGGPSTTAGFTAASNWTTLPTVLTPIWGWTLDPYKGTQIYDRPPGRTWDCPVSNGFVLRMTAPAAVNVLPSGFFGRT